MPIRRSSHTASLNMHSLLIKEINENSVYALLSDAKQTKEISVLKYER